MNNRWFIGLFGVAIIAGTAYLCSRVGSSQDTSPRLVAAPGPLRERALKTVTLNTGAYSVPPGADKRSESIVAEEDMHIVSLSHFTGVQTGSCPTDNGHVLSTSPDNPWVKWETAATGMEPTGTEGYFGYCGRDYYSECTGVSDIMWQEQMPAGCHILVRKGETLYMHTYTGNGTGGPRMFHHLVRVYYW
jgi:hypothetical protein